MNRFANLPASKRLRVDGKGNLLMSASAIVLLASIQLFSCFTVFGQGFKQIIPIVPSPITKNTGEKPQSKVWYHDGRWWAIVVKSDGTFVARLDGTQWNYNLKISSSMSSEADCKVMGGVCHIFLWKKPQDPSQLVSVEYDRESRSYKPWSLRKGVASIPLDSGSETGTIDVDGTGRMWLASDGIDDVRVRWSDPPYETWNGPLIIASGITDDDISALISLPGLGMIGVLWSNQNSKRFGFKTHSDGAAPSEWSVDEAPASSNALDIGHGLADDHLNLAAARDGTLYCSVKTGYDTDGYPRLALLKRRTDGRWDDLYEVSQTGTRGIVVLNEVARKMRVVYTAQEDGGPILYRESPMDNVSFGEALTLIEGVYNNPTSAKDKNGEDILILASDETILAGVLASDRPVIHVGLASRADVEEQSIQYFPNPADDVLIIEFGEIVNEEVFIAIADAAGKTLLDMRSVPFSSEMRIDLASLQRHPGVYFLILRTGGRNQVLKFIKQ